MGEIAFGDYRCCYGDLGRKNWQFVNVKGGFVVGRPLICYTKNKRAKEM